MWVALIQVFILFYFFTEMHRKAPSKMMPCHRTRDEESKNEEQPSRYRWERGDGRRLLVSLCVLIEIIISLNDHNYVSFRYSQRRTKMSFGDWYLWTVIETQNEMNSSAVHLLTCSKPMHYYLNQIFLISMVMDRFLWRTHGGDILEQRHKASMTAVCWWGCEHLVTRTAHNKVLFLVAH